MLLILAEFITIYILLPLLFFYKVIPLLLLIPVLWLVAVYSIFILKKHRVAVFSFSYAKEDLKEIFYRFLLISLIIAYFTYIVYPEKLFVFILTNPLVALIIFILYPLLSVTAQEIIFRRFFFFRYRQLFPANLILFFNVFAFGFVHIVFQNYLAVLFTLAGGYLFAKTYLKRGSLFTVFIEHSLYGNGLIAIGLGEFFYHGA